VALQAHPYVKILAGAACAAPKLDYFEESTLGL
jgi:hypothetical protein